MSGVNRQVRETVSAVNQVVPRTGLYKFVLKENFRTDFFYITERLQETFFEKFRLKKIKDR